MFARLSPAAEVGDRYAEHTAGSVSVGLTLSPAGEGIDGSRYAHRHTGDGVRYAHRHTGDGGRYVDKHTAGSTVLGRLSPAAVGVDWSVVDWSETWAGVGGGGRYVDKHTAGSTVFARLSPAAVGVDWSVDWSETWAGVGIDGDRYVY